MAYSDLRAAMAGKDLPEDIKQKFLALHEENVTLKETYKTAQDKLNKAKQVIYLNMLRNTRRLFNFGQFIKSQDKLFKEQHAANVATASVRARF